MRHGQLRETIFSQADMGPFDYFNPARIYLGPQNLGPSFGPIFPLRGPVEFPKPSPCQMYRQTQQS